MSARIPVHRLANALFQRGKRSEPKFLLRTRDIKATTGLTIGLGAVPDDFTGEAGDPRNQVHKPPDGNLDSAANVYRFGLLIEFGGQQNRFGAVTNVEKFSRRRAGAPHGDVAFPAPKGL